MSNGNNPVWKSILIPAAIALIAGGSSPWWWPIVFTPKDKIVICAENEFCEGRVLECLSSGDRPSEVSPNTWLKGPNSIDYGNTSFQTSKIEFGPWNNQECGLSGAGWHAKIGSCGTATGFLWQRCVQVKIEIK